MTFDECRKIVCDYLDDLYDLNVPGGFKVVLVDSHTREETFGWVFFYTSEDYIRTGETKYALAGNAPLIVNRNSGKIIVTGTAYSIEHYIEEYKQELENS